jgi:hypothetical protein
VLSGTEDMFSEVDLVEIDIDGDLDLIGESESEEKP